MAYKKGQSGNPKGRTPGIKNHKPIKDRIENLLEKNFDLIEQEMETATPEVRRDFFINLAGAVLPTKSTTKES